MARLSSREKCLEFFASTGVYSPRNARFSQTKTLRPTVQLSRKDLSWLFRKPIAKRQPSKPELKSITPNMRIPSDETAYSSRTTPIWRKPRASISFSTTAIWGMGLWVAVAAGVAILLLDQVAVAVLLWTARCASEFRLQMAALDPAGHGVRVDPQRLCKTVGGVEAPVVLETHSFQLEVNSSYRARVSGSLQLQTDSLIAHPRIPGQNR